MKNMRCHANAREETILTPEEYIEVEVEELMEMYFDGDFMDNKSFGVKIKQALKDAVESGRIEGYAQGWNEGQQALTKPDNEKEV